MEKNKSVRKIAQWSLRETEKGKNRLEKIAALENIDNSV